MSRIRINKLDKFLKCPVCAGENFSSDDVIIQTINSNGNRFDETHKKFGCLSCGWNIIFEEKYDTQINSRNITIED